MKILIYPRFAGGEGWGHLQRSLNLAGRLGPGACLLLDKSKEIISGFLKQNNAPVEIRRVFDPKERWDLVVLDRRKTEPKEIARFAPHSPVLGIDEGGPARSSFTFLIDSLPGGTKREAANLNCPSLLALPERRRRKPGRSFRRVLISFGGEDPEDLSGRLLAVLLNTSISIFAPLELTVVEGPFFSRRSWPPGVTILRELGDLKSHLSDYDLVFTSYGLTCFEALACGVPVILLNPSRYHHRLSRNLHLPDIGIRRPRIGKLKRLLANPGTFERLLESIEPLLRKQEPDLDSLLARVKGSSDSLCPVCRSFPNPALARFSDRSFFRCRSCGIIYLKAFSGEEKVYGEDYFFREYKQQYGKTYIEDFDRIKKMSARRLKRISRLAGGRKNLLILDVGCAYGAFLATAREEGFETAGIDISAQAVRYVAETLKIPCMQGDFASDLPSPPVEMKPDVISMWFVIEHFRRPDRVLKRVNRLLKNGGIFSFSTPNGAGISARKNLKSFLQNSPDDHYTVWTPHTARLILSRFGFRVRSYIVTGHHPERFPWYEKKEQLTKEPCVRMTMAASRVLGLGDTFEVYAEKVAES